MTDLCGTTRLGGQVCPREVWLHVQTVSLDDGRLDPVFSINISNGTNYNRAQTVVGFNKWLMDLNNPGDVLEQQRNGVGIENIGSFVVRPDV